MPHKILLIDDDRLNIALVKFALAEQRYEVMIAPDGLDGLKKYNETKPDLIVLDIQMPKMNGYEFMTELRHISPGDHVPVIMLTASETLEDVFRMEGVKGYFVKPVDLPKLIEKIKQLLGPNPIE